MTFIKTFIFEQIYYFIVVIVELLHKSIEKIRIIFPQIINMICISQNEGFKSKVYGRLIIYCVKTKYDIHILDYFVFTFVPQLVYPVRVVFQFPFVQLPEGINFFSQSIMCHLPEDNIPLTRG